LLGDEYTIFDIAFSGWLDLVAFVSTQDAIAGCPNLKRHLDGISA
jgi:glutathione S-transferase